MASTANKFLGKAAGLDMLGTQATKDSKPTEYTQYTEGTEYTKDTPKKAAKKKYRVNLALDGELETYLHNIAWTKRTSITQYINDLIRADREAYLANGGDTTGWEDED